MVQHDDPGGKNRTAEDDDTNFWPTTKLFVIAAAEDLGIDLNIYYANGNFVMLLQQVEEVLANEETRPD